MKSHAYKHLTVSVNLKSSANIHDNIAIFSAYLHRFSMPGGESNETYKNMWYSFDVGLAHFVVINTETDFYGAPSGPWLSTQRWQFRS